MEVSYRKLFSVSVSHEHFGGQRCPDLSVEPVAATARIMQGSRMRLRPETGGASAFIAAANLNAEALPKQPLVFALVVRDPRFYQYTMLDRAASPNASVAIFDNLQILQDQIREDSMLLARPGEIRLLPTGNRQDSAAAMLDRPVASVFGLVSIHLGQAESPAVPSAMKSFSNGKPQEPRFVVPLLARRARWRYLIAGADQTARIEAVEVPTDKPIEFGDATASEVAGKRALMYQSGLAYPVLADPRGIYSAKLISSNGDERLLPLPSTASLRADADGDGMVAEMVALAETVA